MKKRFSKKKLLAVNIPIMAVIAVIMVAVIIASVMFADTISLYLYGLGSIDIDEKTLSEGTQLCEDITEEGIVLLKNDSDSSGNAALPLSEDEISKVNVFGWAAYDWMTCTFGSGYSNTNLEKMKFFDALDEAGIEYNTTLYNMYKNFYSATVSEYGISDLREYRGDVGVGTTQKFILHEPGEAYYTDEVIDEAREFSDVALVVIGRTGGEAADLCKYQDKQPQTNGSTAYTRTTDRTYLQLSTEEEEMIAAAESACSKVIVILNVSNTMECGFIDDDDISAALLVGLTGLTGVRSVINVLRGEKEVEDENGDTETVTVNPSGRTVDTYAYDISSAPSSVNAGYDPTYYTNRNTYYYDAYIDYYEGIYVGYKYYETAAYEGYIDYESTVQYPFGYGLSYTTFEWNVIEIEINGEEYSYKPGTAIPLAEDDDIVIYVSVENTGDMAGMDVVEVYYTAPYYEGEIEKSSVVLADFAKTAVIEPGESKNVRLEFTVQSMASYDCYDANGNGHAGYELDSGNYYIKFMKDSHDSADMGEDSICESAVHCTIPSGGYDYDTDEATGNTVENRFTGTDTIDNCDLDGSEEGADIVYLSRADFAGTFPTAKVTRSQTSEAQSVATATTPTDEQLEATGYADAEMPDTSHDAGITIDNMMTCEGYDDPDWQDLICEITTSELFELVRNGYFKTAAIASVGKAEYVDLDGPGGLNTRVTSSTSCSFIAYPNETLIAQTWDTDLAYAMGMSVGTEASDSNAGIRGWYGPAANIHRNPYDGRNGEYYSEDAILSGKFAAQVVKGAKDMGLYCYMKHFAANETETNRSGLFTFMTEQTLRELYLKPFELAVKDGGANALMTSMNRIGRTWSGATYGLCTQILREEWGFNGTLVTDWMDTGSRYMTVYKGIWAGNDIWLNNTDADSLFNDSAYNTDPVFVSLAQNVAHDVLWTLVDTEQVRQAYDPDAAVSGGSFSQGRSYNRTWVWYIVLIEVVLAAVIVVMAIFLAKKIKRLKAEAASLHTSEDLQSRPPEIKE